MFVQATTSSRQNGKSYVSYLVRESFRTPKGPRSRTVCNITGLPPHTRDLIVASLQAATPSEVFEASLPATLVTVAVLT